MALRICSGLFLRRCPVTPFVGGARTVFTATGGDYQLEDKKEFRHPNWPSKVKIVEVGPRDGLQNEANFVPTDHKIILIDRLSKTGLRVIESTSFVSRKRIPQFVDAGTVYGKIKKEEGVSYPVLVPNMKGLDAAMEAGAKEVAIFTGASQHFVKKNINQTIEESLKNYREVAEVALQEKIRIRGYVSCVISCPYIGLVNPERVADVAEELLAMGCYEISLGDTVGTGTPGEFRRMLYTVMKRIPVDRLAVHCHDTYGQALANIATALEFGIATVDSSVGGLGGCPYAPGASGNVATEDVVYMLHGMGIATGVDLHKLMKVSKYISGTVLERPKSNSKVTQAFPTVATDHM